MINMEKKKLNLLLFINKEYEGENMFLILMFSYFSFFFELLIINYSMSMKIPQSLQQ